MSSWKPHSGFGDWLEDPLTPGLLAIGRGAPGAKGVGWGEEPWAAALGRTGPLAAFVPLCSVWPWTPQVCLWAPFPVSLTQSPLMPLPLIHVRADPSTPRMAARLTPGRNEIFTWTTHTSMTSPSGCLCDTCFTSATLTLLFSSAFHPHICVTHPLPSFKPLLWCHLLDSGHPTAMLHAAVHSPSCPFLNCIFFPRILIAFWHTVCFTRCLVCLPTPPPPLEHRLRKG